MFTVVDKWRLCCWRKLKTESYFWYNLLYSSRFHKLLHYPTAHPYRQDCDSDESHGGTMCHDDGVVFGVVILSCRGLVGWGLVQSWPGLVMDCHLTWRALLPHYGQSHIDWSPCGLGETEGNKNVTLLSLLRYFEPSSNTQIKTNPKSWKSGLISFTVKLNVRLL